MNIEEAIRHTEKVVEEKENIINNTYATLEEDRPLFENEETECMKCAEEHRQLAEWLKELLKLRRDWQQLKETITEIRDNNKYEHKDVTSVTKFLVRYMNVLENGEQEV